MAVAYGSVSNTTWANRTNTVITPPSGLANGDLLLLFQTLGGTTIPTPTPPAGFSVVPNITWPLDVTDGTYTMSTRVWFKVASGESGSYTITHTVADSQGVIVRLTGQASVGSIFPSLTSGNPVEGRHRAPGGPADDQDLTQIPTLGPTTAANGMVVLFAWDWGDSGNDLTPPVDGTVTFTERLDVAPLSYVATAPIGNAASTGAVTMQQNSASSSPWGGMMMWINPSTGPPPASISGSAAGSGATTGNLTVTQPRAGPSLANTSAQMTSSGNRQSFKQHNEAAGGIPWLNTVLPGDKFFTSAQTSSTGAQGVGQSGVMRIDASAQMTSTGRRTSLGTSLVLTRAAVTFRVSGTKDAPEIHLPTDAIPTTYWSDAIPIP